MAHSEAKIRHLEIIQGVINRMAGNLFYLKGWAITLIGGALAFASNDTNSLFLLLPYYPILMFWGLDGYFLSQERLFRALYDDIRKKDDSEIDFSMSTKPHKKNIHNTWLGSVSSLTLGVFYVPLLVIVIIFTIVKLYV